MFINQTVRYAYSRPYFLKSSVFKKRAINEIIGNLRFRISYKPKLIAWQLHQHRVDLLFELIEGCSVSKLDSAGLIAECAVRTSLLHQQYLLADESCKAMKRKVILLWLASQRYLIVSKEGYLLKRILDIFYEFYYFLDVTTLNSYCTLIHGDLAGNLFMTHKGLYFVDFENAFFFDPLFEISSLFVRHDLYRAKNLFLNKYELAPELDSDFRIYNALNVLIDSLWSHKSWIFLMDNRSRQLWAKRLDYLLCNLRNIDNLSMNWSVVT